MTSATDADGRRIGYSYDLDDRMTGETWFSAAGATIQLETWSYDAVGNMLTAQAPGGAYTFAYDADNRLTVVQEPFGLTLTMGYDTASNRTSVHDSQGGYTTVTFNSLNEVTDTALSGSGITPVQQLESYDADGEVSVVTRETYTGGVWVTAGTTSYAYDNAGRTTQITDFTGAGAVLASLVYVYNAGGLVTSETNDGVLRTYAYDAGNELTDDGGTLYSYDSNGNRNMAGYVVGTNNQVTTDGTTTFSYDAAGNVTQTTVGANGATWTYAYDNAERLVGASYSATRGGTVTTMVTYIYDAFGNRIEEDTWVSGSGTTTTRFGVDGWSTTQPAPVGNENYNDLIDLNGSNAVVDRRLWGQGVAQPLVREDASGNVGWYTTDELGNVVGVTNGSGTPLTTITYDGFGNVLSNSTPAQSDRYLRAGGQYDSTLGLWDFNQRVTNGKFWSQPDPIFPQADPTNSYRVVGNDSVNEVDPSGLEVILPVTVRKEGVKEIRASTVNKPNSVLATLSDKKGTVVLEIWNASGILAGRVVSGDKPILFGHCVPPAALNEWYLEVDAQGKGTSLIWYNVGVNVIAPGDVAATQKILTEEGKDKSIGALSKAAGTKSLTDFTKAMDKALAVAQQGTGKVSYLKELPKGNASEVEGHKTLATLRYAMELKDSKPVLMDGKPVVKVERLYIDQQNQLVWKEDKNTSVGAAEGYFSFLPEKK